MNCRVKICFSVFLLLLACQGFAQLPAPAKTSSNLRTRKIAVRADSARIDTLSIVPGSFQIRNVNPDAYRVDEVKAFLYWKKKPATDSVEVVYRVFPFQLSAIKQRISYTDSIVNNFYSRPFEFNYGLTDEQKGIFNFGDIKAEGSIGRQVGFGNKQDAVLNSTLNLQLSGMLADSIEIQAAITDNNIPVQPDGTTQNLNEFDQVYMQFKKKNWQVNLGDLDIRQNKDYFLNFYKRLQGASVQLSNRISKTVTSSTLASGSIAKGKFTRNIFDGLEGNQGPYRLTGASNEYFFIVLANTERVFINGELLQRGEDRDYVINYNTAEVTFTPKRMITKDSRIQIEFEYADRNYLNANLYLSQEFNVNKKLKIRVGAFRNADAKNSSIQQKLDTPQIRFLAGIGDNIDQALYPSAQKDTLTGSNILYEKVIITPGVDSFYRYTVDPALARYNLAFTNVGQGKGNYVPDFNGANGKVYKYVAPVAGVKQGSFEPALLLVTPKRQEIMNLGIEYAISRTTNLKTEIATSYYDLNTFSSKDDGDNRAWAAKVQLNNDALLKQGSRLQLGGSLDYEYVQKRFKPLERLRSVEFSRDWGLPLVLLPADESILKANAVLKSKNSGSLTYQLISYNRSDKYNGLQQSLIQASNVKGWQLNNQLVVTSFNGQFDKGTVFKPVIDISKRLKKLANWNAGLRYALEQNTSRYKLTDTLVPLTFNFSTWSVYLKSDETKKNRYGITFFTRTDKYPVAKDFVKGDRSLNLNLQTELLGNAKRQFYLNATFRKLKVFNPLVSKQKEDETILGRAEYNMNEWKGFVRGNVLYETGAGQEQKRDYAYLEVPPGTGMYAWIDYNGDNVQQLNEFEVAAFPDQAKFIRIFTPTNEFIKANYITFSYRFDISPRNLFGNNAASGAKRFFSRINYTTSLQTSKKSLSAGSFEFNPFKYGINNNALITAFTDIFNNFSFNRISSKWGFDFSNHRRSGKSLLTYGYESTRLNDWLLKWRWNISRNASLTINGRKGQTALTTAATQFTNRNYRLSVYSAEPFITFIRGTSFRIVTGYKFDTRQNAALFGGEKSTTHSLNIESKYNLLQNSSLNAKFTFSNIAYKGTTNTTVGYIMLDGLLPGKNYLWSLGLTKRLLNNLELNVQYDGRKSGTSSPVHLGRVGATALF